MGIVREVDIARDTSVKEIDRESVCVHVWFNPNQNVCVCGLTPTKIKEKEPEPDQTDNTWSL